MFITQKFKVKIVHFAQIVSKCCEKRAVYEFCVTLCGKFKLLFGDLLLFLESHGKRDAVALCVNFEDLNAHDIADRKHL